MLCSNGEVEEPPGPGRPSYYPENEPPTRGHDWHSQSTSPPNWTQDFARVVRLTPEAAPYPSTPGLCLTDVPSCFTHTSFEGVHLLSEWCITPGARQVTNGQARLYSFLARHKAEEENER
jgi:hypothetical protein